MLTDPWLGSGLAGGLGEMDGSGCLGRLERG